MPGSASGGTDGRRPSASDSGLVRRLGRTVTRTIVEHGLIDEGDHILVAMSGGKDSYTLFDLLCRARRRAPHRFTLTAVHLDQGQPGYDGAPLVRWLEATGERFEILRRDTYTPVVERTPAGKSFCFLCSRLRRGELYAAAARLGCNKLALGHHRDDSLETFLMNLFYAGKLEAMPARYVTDDGRFTVIRPLIECAEADIRAHAEAAAYPLLPCNLCSSQRSEREAMAALLDGLEAAHPDVRAVMLTALKNVHPSHLLDRGVAAAWAAHQAPGGAGERPPGVAPDPDPARDPDPFRARMNHPEATTVSPPRGL